MIRPQSCLKVLDNSGAKEVQCIQILGGSSSAYASVGDLIVVSVKKVFVSYSLGSVKRELVSKGDVHCAIVVCVTKEYHNKYGIWTRFINNAVVLIKENGSLFGTRIRGTVSRNLRFKKQIKVLSLARSVI